MTHSNLNSFGEEFTLHESTALESSEGFTLCEGTVPRNVSEESVLQGLRTQSIVKLIRDTQELDLQCRWIISQLCSHAQYGPSLALVPQSLLQHYSVDKDHLLRYVDHVLVPAQESI